MPYSKLGNVVLNGEGKPIEIISQALITFDSNKLNGRFEFKSGSEFSWQTNPRLIDHKQDWYRDTGGWDYLMDGDKKIGLKLLNIMVTSFGGTNTFLHSWTHLTTNFLKYGIEWNYAQILFSDKSWRSKRESSTSLSGFTSLDFEFLKDPNFQEILAEANFFQEALFRIQQRQSITVSNPALLSISDKNVRKLNTYTTADTITEKTIIGKGYNELQSILLKLLGTIDYNNRDSRIYKILNIKIHETKSLLIRNTYFRNFDSNWNAKAWFKEILSIFQEYEGRIPAQLDSIDQQLKDTLIVQSGPNKGKSIFNGMSFTNDYKFTQDDIVLKDKVLNILMYLLGRYTVSKMITGSIFFNEDILSFFAPTQESLLRAGRDWQISLPYLEIPSRGSDDSSYFADHYEQLQFDLLYAPIEFRVPIHTGVSNQLYTIPQVPQKLVNPYYKSASASHSYSMNYDYGLWSTNNRPDFIARGLPREMTGMSLLAEDLIYLYKEQIAFHYDELVRQGLTDNQITLYTRIGIERLFSQIFSSSERNMRGSLDHYFNLRGFTTVDLDLISTSFNEAPDIFSKLRLTPEMRDIFSKYEDQISNSLSISTSIDDIDQQIISNLIASREVLIQIEDFLIDIANTYGKVRIYGFILGKHGYHRTGTLYYPDVGVSDPNMPTNDQRYYELDPANLGAFDFHLFLGGLLADHQTFIIRREGMEKNEALFAFSLLDIGLPLETITSSVSGSRPGFPSLGGLFTSDQLAHQQLSASWFNIQSFLFMNKMMNGLVAVPRTITEWRQLCQSSGVSTSL